MHAADLVTHGVGGNVLLGALLEATGLLHSFLEHGLVGLPDAADAEVHAGSDLFDFDAGETLAAALGVDEVDAEVDGGLDFFVASVLLGADGNDVLQTLDVDLVVGVTLEEVNQHALGERVLIGDGALKGGSGKEKHRSQTDGEFLRLELGDGTEALWVEVKLEHVERLVGKGADKGERVGALLLAAAKEEKAGVVFLGEELERGCVVEGVDGVLLCELLGQGLAHLVEIVEGILDDLRARRSAEEKACLGVLFGLGLTLLERALGASVAGFSSKHIVSFPRRKKSIVNVLGKGYDVHLAEHLELWLSR